MVHAHKLLSEELASTAKRMLVPRSACRSYRLRLAHDCIPNRLLSSCSRNEAASRLPVGPATRGCCCAGPSSYREMSAVPTLCMRCLSRSNTSPRCSLGVKLVRTGGSFGTGSAVLADAAGNFELAASTLASLAHPSCNFGATAAASAFLFAGRIFAGSCCSEAVCLESSCEGCADCGGLEPATSTRPLHMHMQHCICYQLERSLFEKAGVLHAVSQPLLP
jgi:hypothetical protein